MCFPWLFHIYVVAWFTQKGSIFWDKNKHLHFHTYLYRYYRCVYIYMQVSNPGIVWEGSIGETGVIAVMGRACSKSGQCMEMQWSGLLPISGLRAANSSDEFMRRVLGNQTVSAIGETVIFFFCYVFLPFYAGWHSGNPKTYVDPITIYNCIYIIN